jgi:hypothetical protein
MAIMEEKKRFKFNVVDVVILVAVLAAAAFFLGRYAVRPAPQMPLPSASPNGEYEIRILPFEMILDAPEVPNVRFEGKINVGDMVIDRSSGVELGEITNITVNPSISFATTAEGQIVRTSTPLHSHLVLTVSGMGYRPYDGGLAVAAPVDEEAEAVRSSNDVFHSMVNKEFEIHVGDFALFMRFQNFTLDESYIPPLGKDDPEEE